MSILFDLWYCFSLSNLAICNIVILSCDSPPAKLGFVFQRLSEFCHLGGVSKVIADHDVAVLQVVDNPLIGQALRVEPAVGPARPMFSGCGRSAVVIHSHTFVDMVGSLDGNLNSDSNWEESDLWRAWRADAKATGR